MGKGTENRKEMPYYLFRCHYIQFLLQPSDVALREINETWIENAVQKNTCNVCYSSLLFFVRLNQVPMYTTMA